jgi:hypothetical protein
VNLVHGSDCPTGFDFAHEAVWGVELHDFGAHRDNQLVMQAFGVSAKSESQAFVGVFVCSGDGHGGTNAVLVREERYNPPARISAILVLYMALPRPLLNSMPQVRQRWKWMSLRP